MFTNGDELNNITKPDENTRRFACKSCDVHWMDSGAASKCWYCGETISVWTVK